MPEDYRKNGSKVEPDPTDQRPPFLISIISVVACGVLVIPVFAFQAPDWKSFTSITALGVAVAGASLLVGALTGFLFGIPRKLQQDRPAPSSQGGVLHDSYTDMFKLLPNQPRSAPRLDGSGQKAPTDLHASVTERRKHPPISHSPYRKTVPLLSAGDSRVFTIYAMLPWNETGLYLEAGVTYQFKSAGEWLDRTVTCGPDGTNDGDFHPSELAHLAASALGELESLFKKVTKNQEANFKFTKRHDRLEGDRVPWFCLVGAIANGGGATSNGKPAEHDTFRIGSARSYKPVQFGYFYAYGNDAWNFYENNRGSVTLTVSR